MDKLLKVRARKEIIIVLRTEGEMALGAGVITAALNKAFDGWTPMYWFLLALAFFFLVLCSIMSRMMPQSESKKERGDDQ